MLRLCSGDWTQRRQDSVHHLHWHAVMGFEDTVRMTAEWYRAYYQQPADIALTTNNQIADYTAIAKLHGLEWAQ